MVPNCSDRPFSHVCAAFKCVGPADVAVGQGKAGTLLGSEH